MKPTHATTLTRCTVASPIGDLQLSATLDALIGLSFKASSGPAGKPNAHPILALVAAQLEDYFAGTRTHFDVPLAPPGTPFQTSVWNALRCIPFGARRAYRDIAYAIGQPAAVRAVGAANGRNPIGIIVPCHRVIGANGSLTGFAGGLDAKRWLLTHEREHTPFALYADQQKSDLVDPLGSDPRTDNHGRTRPAN